MGNGVNEQSLRSFRLDESSIERLYIYIKSRYTRKSIFVSTSNIISFLPIANGTKVYSISKRTIFPLHVRETFEIPFQSLERPHQENQRA